MTGIELRPDGIEINDYYETNLKELYVAGEASGGVHGRNRLIGNSVLDYNVFGRGAGKCAAEYIKSANIRKLTLQHITHYENELKRAKIKTDLVALVLLSPLILQKTCASASSLPTTKAP